MTSPEAKPMVEDLRLWNLAQEIKVFPELARIERASKTRSKIRRRIFTQAGEAIFVEARSGYSIAGEPIEDHVCIAKAQKSGDRIVCVGHLMISRSRLRELLAVLTDIAENADGIYWAETPFAPEIPVGNPPFVEP